jgi:transcriptional regulator with XRE-family HTH domain
MDSTVKDPGGLGSISVQTSKPKRSIKQRKKSRSQAELYNAKVEQLHGLPPLNPFRSLRELGFYHYYDNHHNVTVNAPKVHGQTLVSLATKAGVSKQALIRTEQGTFPSIPPKLLTFYQSLGLDYIALSNGYEIYQRLLRQRHYLLFGRPLLVRRALKEEPEVHTLTLLRSLWHFPSEPLKSTSLLDEYDNYSYGPPVGSSLNNTEIAKLLCLSQSSLTHWENHPKRQKSVPKHFLNALTDNGYRMQDLSSIVEHYSNFRRGLS